MKSKIFLSFFVFLISWINSFSQFNQWVWIHGSSAPAPLAITGTQGVAAPANTPGGNYEGCEWTDNNGNFWILLSGSYFWKYDPTTNMWTWIRNGVANFGTQGVPSAASYPGGHGYGALTWTDLNNNLWLYGGTASGWDANLWKYNIATGQWTWMKGPGTCTCTQPVHGTKGVASATNHPGSRAETSCTWLDATGNLWFFGGQACNGSCTSGSHAGTYSDVWKYDISTNNWTWMSGPSALTQAPVYGTKGTPATTNTPGGRFVFASGTDLQGNFILFGGSGNVSGPYRNDLWRYNYVTDQWTWLSGTNLSNQNGTYTTKCVPSLTDYPDGGYEERTRWTDDCGNLWVFSPGSYSSPKSALWRYSIANNTWTWVTGNGLANQNGVFGTLGVPAPTNHPGTRKGGNSWRYKTDFYMFGGSGMAATGSNSSINDMWKYIPDKPVASFTYTSTGSCAPSTVTFTNSSTPGCNEIKSYLWDFGDPASGANNNSTDANPTHIYNASGTYTIKLLVINCTGSKDSVSHNFTTATSLNTSGSVNLCTGQTATIHGVIQNTAGIYTQTFTSAVTGCDSVSTITLTIGNPITTSTVITLCSGQSATIHGNNQNTSGVYTQTFTAAAGCDSISSVTLTVNSTSTTTISPVSCASYTVNSQVYSSTGIYTQTLTNAAGCDSVLTINLTVTPVINTNNSQTICTGSSVIIHGVNQTTSGIYSQTFVSSSGCDSVSVINLTVVNTPTLTVSPLIDTIYNGTSIIISANGASAYSWSNGNSTSSIIVSPTQTSTYCVVGSNSVICTDTVCSDIVVLTGNCDNLKIFIPTGFSPNGDGQNDELKLFATAQVEALLFTVYNRWGQIVFETTDITKSWDGNFNSRPMDAAVFTYTLRYTCKSDNAEEVISGNISLVK